MELGSEIESLQKDIKIKQIIIIKKKDRSIIISKNI
jgi:hypothetical protein